MDLTENQQNQIRAAVNSGRTARHTQANRTILGIGPAGQALRSYMVLAGHDGELTPFGTYYYGLTHETPADRTLRLQPTHISTRGHRIYQGPTRQGSEASILGAFGRFRIHSYGEKVLCSCEGRVCGPTPSRNRGPSVQRIAIL